MVPPVITHYKVLEKLGEGGMGVVYKAQDTNLDRLVALKFLPPHVAASTEDKARFLQEAKAAAALNHTNICTIYGVDESEGTMFIAMEFIEGGTLREKIPFARVEDALGIAAQIGDALQEAHAKGIVHRDIKADNVMLTSRGQAKVMDFGLAKLRGSLKLTKTSSTLGTIGYMAPEQIQGGEADNRCDIFSFGVLLFEMLTGRLPFRGEHEAAMMYSILNEEPSDVRALRSDVPEDVGRIIRRALEKDPADRYQHVDDMVSELRRARKQTANITRPTLPQGAPVPPVEARARQPRRTKAWIGAAGGALIAVVAATLLYKALLAPGGGPVTSRKMLVVLPFENLGATDQEYFADGITEEITSKLSSLSGLGVIARSSAMQYKKSAKTLKQIGQELNVAYILQGTIRWESAGGATNVRVTPQLVNVGDGTQMWSEPFEAVLAGSFKLQTEIAGNVARALDVALLQPERRSLEASPTTNPEAYDSYLRGLSFFHRSYSERDLRAAEQLLTRAVQLDPNFAAAYGWLSEAHSDIYWEYYDHREERIVKAKEAAETSLRLDPALAVAHVAMGTYYYHGKLEYDNALREFEQALTLQPSNVEALLSIGAVKRRQGKFEEAAANFARCVEMDPRAGAWPAELSITYLLLRRFPEAERYADRAMALSPDWSDAYVFKSDACLRSAGDVSKARAVLDDAENRKIGVQDPHFVYASVALGMLEGKYESALERLSRFEPKAFDVQEYFIPVELLKAQILGHMNHRKEELLAYDSARLVLERLAEEHPEDSRIHASLGLAYAGLGRKAEAVREGKLAVEQLPISREALRGIFRAGDLALIYAMAGEQDAALDLLEKLLTVPSPYTAAVLRIDPAWEGLRGNPRFQRLIGGKDVQ